MTSLNYSRLDSWKKTKNTIYVKINTVTYIPQDKIDFCGKRDKDGCRPGMSLWILPRFPFSTLYENGRKPVSSLLLEAISGKVSPQQVEETVGGETTD